MLDTLLETALSVSGSLDEYGNPKLGKCFCSKRPLPTFVKTVRQLHRVLTVAGFGADQDINGADLVDAINVAFPAFDRAIKQLPE